MGMGSCGRKVCQLINHMDHICHITTRLLRDKFGHIRMCTGLIDLLSFISSLTAFHSILYCHHTVIRTAFVCLSVCLFILLLLRGPLTDLRQTCCRWTSELPLRASFLKRSTGQRVNSSNITFSEQKTPG